MIDDTSQTHFGSQSGLVINLSREGKQKTFCSILKLEEIKHFVYFWWVVLGLIFYIFPLCPLFTLQRYSHESWPSLMLVQRLE